MGNEKQDKSGVSRKREHHSSQSSDNSQGTPEAKQVGEISIAFMVTIEEITANEVAAHSRQNLALAAI